MPNESEGTGFGPQPGAIMKTRNLIAFATFGGLMVAAGCAKKDNNAADTAGTAAMADTGMGAGSMAPAPTMTDSTGAATGTMADTTASVYGDTIKR